MDLNEAKQGTESIRGTGGAEAKPPCGREKTCCSCDNAEAVSDSEAPDVCGQENTELPKETEDSNPETTDEPKRKTERRRVTQVRKVKRKTNPKRQILRMTVMSKSKQRKNPKNR